MRVTVPLVALAALLAAGPERALVDRARGLYEAYEQRWPVPPSDSVRAEADSLTKLANAAGDAHTRAWLLALRAELATNAGRPPAVLAAAGEALSIEGARGDVGLQWRLRRSLAWGSANSGGDSAASAHAAEWAALVRAGAGDRAAAEWAYFRGTRAVRVGQRDTAEAMLREALPRYERLGDIERDIRCRAMLGIVEGMRGNFDPSRTWLRDACSRARKHQRYSSLSNALVNLATLEHLQGHREAAAAIYREAVDIARREQNPLRVIEAMRGLLVIAQDLGRLTEAAALADSVRRYGESHGVAELRGSAWMWIGRIALGEGRLDESLAAARAGLAMADSVPVITRIGLVSTALEALIVLNRPAEALALADSQRADAPAAGVHYASQLEGFRGQALLALGRLRDAEASARRSLQLLEVTGLRSHPYQIGARVLLANIRLIQRRRADAMLEFDEAEAGLFALRSGMSANAARQHTVVSSRELGGFLMRAALAAAAEGNGAGEAFERFETLKGRAVFEQLRSDSTPTDSTWLGGRMTIADFRSSVLRDGEAWVAPYLGPDTGGVFVITRDTFLVAPLRDPAHDARRRLRDLGRALGRRPGDSKSTDATLHAAVATVRTLFAEVLPVLGGARRLLYSPEGPLHDVPGAVLAEAVGAGGQAPEVAEVPSAAILAELRRRDEPPGSGAARVLALTTSARVDSALAGPAAEVNWLRSEFDPVQRVDGGALPPGAEAAKEWPSFDVLHFAGHTRIENERPWQSSLVLGVTPDGGAPAGVRAEEILELELSTRLAVLAACQSVGDRVVGSEGMAGLGAAFLGAGVPTVVATHWRVDDRVTTHLMRAFYGSLARGATASVALREAQSVVRTKREWRHPYYWSAFAVLGDPDRTVPLRTLSPWKRVPWAPLLVSALVFALGFALRPRRRS